jgi:hypothetical protein
MRGTKSVYVTSLCLGIGGAGVVAACSDGTNAGDGAGVTTAAVSSNANTSQPGASVHASNAASSIATPVKPSGIPPTPAASASSTLVPSQSSASGSVAAQATSVEPKASSTLPTPAGSSSAGSVPSVVGSAGSAPAPVASCNVAPVNPKATQQVKTLLCYLYSIYGKKVLSGQQETSWSKPELV